VAKAKASASRFPGKLQKKTSLAVKEVFRLVFEGSVVMADAWLLHTLFTIPERLIQGETPGNFYG